MKREIQLAGMFAAAALLLAFVAAPVQAAHLDNPNLLVDGGFEGTITTDGAPFVGLWEGFTGGPGAPTSDFTATMPRLGLQSLEMNLDESGGFAGAFQDVAIPAAAIGSQYWYSGWHKLGDNSVADGSENRIEWLDAGLGEITRHNINVSPAGTTYEEFVSSDTVPAGAAFARIVYNIQSFGAAAPQQVFADDLNFNIAGVVPEPASIGLAAFACVTMLGMRRRS